MAWAVAALLLVLLVPWPGRVEVSGWLRPAQSLTLFAPPTGAQLVNLPLGHGQSVQSGQLLMGLHLPETFSLLQVNATRIDRLEWVAASSGFQDDTRQRMRVSQEDHRTALAERDVLLGEVSRFKLIAPFDGHLVDVDPDYQKGQWLARKERLGVLVAPGKMVVETYFDEDDVKRVRAGDQGIFITDGREGPVLPVRISKIDQDATRMLAQGFLASVAGGHIAVRESGGQLFPEHAIFRVVLEVEGDPGELARQSWRGTVVVRGEAQPMAWRYFKNVAAVLWRETGF